MTLVKLFVDITVIALMLLATCVFFMGVLVARRG